TRFNM
ncbi:hypothetical protein MIMGU_mgv1a0125652mg, partial [Erythranthe guttata]